MKRTGRGGGNQKPGRPPAPKCDDCRSPMRPASATEWKCINEKCARYGLRVNTGVFPT